MAGSGFESELRRRVERSRSGYRAFCATIDLLGVTRMLEKDPWEAMSRLNDLQRSFAHASLFFPSDAQERACFAGDSWFMVREVRPDEDEGGLWKLFCGRVFALVSIAAAMEHDLGNPGIRVIASRGRLVQIIDPDEWRDDSIKHQTRNWFVLTGAAEALGKCLAAERAGKRHGFAWGHFWHEELDHELQYLGTPLATIDLRAYGDPSAYARIYDEMCGSADNHASLPAELLKK